MVKTISPVSAARGSLVREEFDHGRLEGPKLHGDVHANVVVGHFPEEVLLEVQPYLNDHNLGGLDISVM
eukprot:CAMPEP_0113536266 /NCGR_PEP_ID=MMETSP0015_2-20120614/6158_1 /TAXON_ID=2838 /ORGANISM="Odontella" /LENGTH=68 /DNA_ID=CAMNT_0000435597 /DNA_START=588 /DNA_END=792 /DNA_ORIENTATION=- /assembly_acc=CAM_ASM_000160